MSRFPRRRPRIRRGTAESNDGGAERNTPLQASNDPAGQGSSGQVEQGPKEMELSEAGDLNPLPPLECQFSSGFTAWLRGMSGSLAVTSYQVNRVMLFSPSGSLMVRAFEGPMGMAVSGNRLAIAGRRDLILFSNDRNAAASYRAEGTKPGTSSGYDAMYLPRTTWHIGPVRAHDVAFAANGLWFVNTQYSCLATLTPDFSFQPGWKPHFISRLAPEDRCHLNGLALFNGAPGYVTALGDCDSPQGWRARRVDGGVLIDLKADEILLGGLSMPHSPRWHEGALWFLESGRGELCRFDVQTKERTVVAALPGYLRGLTFVGPYAVIGLSKIREARNFGGTPVESRFAKLRCGVSIVDTRSGEEVAFAEFRNGASELYDVAFLPGILAPTIYNQAKRRHYDAVTASGFAHWVRLPTHTTNRRANPTTTE